MRVIHNYAVQVFGFEYGEVDVPQGEILLVDNQHGVVTVWISEEKDEMTRMRLRILPTGNEFDDTNMSHVGSCITRGGFVWHVYRIY